MGNGCSLNELKEAILSYDADRAKAAAEKAVAEHVDAFKAITEGLAPGLKEVGEKFEAGEIYLPHLVMAASAMETAVKVLEPAMSVSDAKKARKGTVVIGTVEGDIHNIGKNIVGMMLSAAGYKVIDAGVDVQPAKFLEIATRENAQIIGLSALMTYTLPSMKAVLEYIESKGCKGKFKVVAGGGAVTPQWAKNAGVDGYAEDAVGAVRLIDGLI